MVVSGQLHVPAALPSGKIPVIHWRGGRAGLDGFGEETRYYPYTSGSIKRKPCLEIK
jgi:hypothetical protein